MTLMVSLTFCRMELWWLPYSDLSLRWNRTNLGANRLINTSDVLCSHIHRHINKNKLVRLDKQAFLNVTHCYIVLWSLYCLCILMFTFREDAFFCLNVDKNLHARPYLELREQYRIWPINTLTMKAW